MQGTFDATQFTPNQGGEAHPLGKFPAQISNTEIKPNKANTGGLFVVTFTTPSGSIGNYYNLWNESPKAVEIANKELSALCHATGVFRLDWQNDGAAIRGARCMIEVGEQKDKEGKPTGYVEIKKVYDLQGNEPGKAPVQQQPQTQVSQGAPMVAQPNGGWGTGSAQQAQQPGGWGGATQQQPQPNPNPAPPQAGWQPNPNQQPAQGNPPPPPWKQG